MSFAKSSIAIFVLTSISLNVFADQDTAILQALKTKIEQPVNSDSSYLADINSEAKRFSVVFETTDQVREFYQSHGEHLPAIALTPAKAPVEVETQDVNNIEKINAPVIAPTTEVETQDVSSVEKITASMIAPTTEVETQDVTAIEKVVAPAITPVAVEPKQAPEIETQDVSTIEKVTAPAITPVVTVEATAINAPVVSASTMKEQELASQVDPAAYRKAVTEEQSALVKEEPHSTATKSPTIQATAITAKATAPVKASTLTPSKQVVAASTLTASTKPVEQVKQVQPTVTYVNQGMTAKDRGELLATSHAVSNLAKRESAFEQSTNKRFSDLNKEVSNNKKEANAGISGAMAMANIPQVIQGQTVAIGAGMGGYNGENAVAVGVSARLSQNVTMKATVSDDTESNVGYGVGASIGW